MKSIVDEGLVSITKWNAEHVYYLTKDGARLIDGFSQHRPSQIEHTVMRNFVYIAHDCPDSWDNEIELGIDGKLKLRADAYFTQNNELIFVEIDNKTSMANNRVKIAKYKEILAAATNQCRLTWLTTTMHRQKLIKEYCDGIRANVEVFVLTDFI